MKVRCIIAESHHEPMTSKMHDRLVRLATQKHPEWKISFLDEAPPEETIESRLESIEMATLLWVDTAIFVKEQADIDLTPENLNHAYFTKEPGKNFVDFTKRYFANCEFKQLLETLKSHHVEYKGIDSELISLKVAGTEEKQVSLAMMLLPLRDKIMAEKLSKQSGLVFSRIGLAHVDGVYKHLSDVLPKEAICLYNIYSQPPSVEGESGLEQDVRAGKKPFITVIDATNKSKKELDEIAEKIFADIEKRQTLLDKLPQEIKIAPVKKQAIPLPPLTPKFNDSSLLDFYTQSHEINNLFFPKRSTINIVPKPSRPTSPSITAEKPKYLYGNNEEEWKLIDANLKEAKRLGLLNLTGNQLASLKFKKVTVECFFSHKNCIKILQSRKCTLQDFDPLPNPWVRQLMSEAGVYCLLQGIITPSQSYEKTLPDLEKFLQDEFVKSKTIPLSTTEIQDIPQSYETLSSFKLR